MSLNLPNFDVSCRGDARRGKAWIRNYFFFSGAHLVDLKVNMVSMSEGVVSLCYVEVSDKDIVRLRVSQRFCAHWKWKTKSVCKDFPKPHQNANRPDRKLATNNTIRATVFRRYLQVVVRTARYSSLLIC